LELLRLESLWMQLEPLRMRTTVYDHQLRLSHESCSREAVNKLLYFAFQVGVLSVTL
jgi:hypothetical protein